MAIELERRSILETLQLFFMNTIVNPIRYISAIAVGSLILRPCAYPAGILRGTVFCPSRYSSKD